MYSCGITSLYEVMVLHFDTKSPDPKSFDIRINIVDYIVAMMLSAKEHIFYFCVI